MVICLCKKLQIKYSWETDVPEYGRSELSAGTQLGWKQAWWSWSKWWCSICPKDSLTSCVNVWAALHQPLAYPDPTWDTIRLVWCCWNGIKSDLCWFSIIFACVLYNTICNSLRAQQCWPATCKNQYLQFKCFALCSTLPSRGWLSPEWMLAVTIWHLSSGTVQAGEEHLTAAQSVANETPWESRRSDSRRHSTQARLQYKST